MKIIRCNINDPTTGKGLVGFAYKLDEISYRVKCIRGVYDILNEEINTFFNSFNLNKVLW